MDHLREVNNSHGHMVGDQALAAIARAFKETAGTAATAACAIPMESGATLQVTMSLGVAAYPEDARSIASLVKAADEAVYAATILDSGVAEPSLAAANDFGSRII